MEIHRVILTKAKLAAMPQAERSLLLLLGHASNEINVLVRLIMMARKDDTPSKMVDYVEAGQIFIILRTLIGKLHEAWLLFGKRVQTNRDIANKLLPNLSPEAQTALTELNRHFGGGTPLADIRNKISFHYKDEDNLIEDNFQRLSDTEPWEFYLTGMVFNSFYYASELVVMGSVLKLVNPNIGNDDASGNVITDESAFTELCEEVKLMSGHITELFGGLMGSIVATCIANVDVKIETHPDGPPISRFSLPFYFDEDDIRRQRTENKKSV
jgi:hypothetical protein